MKSVLVFDVDGTLLDMTVLRPFFDDYLHDPDAMYAWFSHFLHSTLVTNEIDCLR